MFEMEIEYLLYVSFSIFTGLVIQSASTVQITHSNNKIVLLQIFPRYLCIKKSLRKKIKLLFCPAYNQITWKKASIFHCEENIWISICKYGMECNASILILQALFDLILLFLSSFLLLFCPVFYSFTRCLIQTYCYCYEINTKIHISFNICPDNVFLSLDSNF